MAQAVLRGRWPLASVRVTHGANTRALDPLVETLLDEAFAAQCSSAEGLTDGTAYRLEDVTDRGGDLDLVLSEERYRTHSALKAVHDDPRIRPEHHDRLLVPDALVTTADGRAVLVRTPKPVGVELQLVGGTATPAQQALDSGADLVSFVRRRVERSLLGSVGRTRVGDVLGVVHHHAGCVNLVVAVQVAVPASRLVATGGAEAVVVPLDELPAWLATAPGYLPAVAELL